MLLTCNIMKVVQEGSIIFDRLGDFHYYIEIIRDYVMSCVIRIFVLLNIINDHALSVVTVQY